MHFFPLLSFSVSFSLYHKNVYNIQNNTLCFLDDMTVIFLQFAKLFYEEMKPYLLKTILGLVIIE